MCFCFRWCCGGDDSRVEKVPPREQSLPQILRANVLVWHLAASADSDRDVAKVEHLADLLKTGLWPEKLPQVQLGVEHYKKSVSGDDMFVQQCCYSERTKSLYDGAVTAAAVVVVLYDPAQPKDALRKMMSRHSTKSFLVVVPHGVELDEEVAVWAEGESGTKVMRLPEMSAAGHGLEVADQIFSEVHGLLKAMGAYERSPEP